MPTDCEICPILQDRNVELNADVQRVREQLNNLRRDVELAIRTLDTESAMPRARLIEVLRGRLATGLAMTAPMRRK